MLLLSLKYILKKRVWGFELPKNKFALVKLETFELQTFCLRAFSIKEAGVAMKRSYCKVLLTAQKK